MKEPRHAEGIVPKILQAIEDIRAEACDGIRSDGNAVRNMKIRDLSEDLKYLISQLLLDEVRMFKEMKKQQEV